ncbi:MAG: glycosyltransferase family 4 protein [Castellaniella sp.]
MAFLLFCGKQFGGMERRYSRLVGFLHGAGEDVVLLCTRDALEGVKNLGVNLPACRVELVDFSWGSDRRGLLKKLNRFFGLLRFFYLASTRRYKQIHIIANPGWFVLLYSVPRRFLPQFSFSVVNSTLSFDPGIVRRVVRGACSVDCLSETIGAYVRAQCKDASDMAKVFVSPCSFTDFSRVRLGVERDIDILMMARFVPGKGYDLFENAMPNIRRGLKIHLCGFGPHPPKIRDAEIYESEDPFGIFSRTKIFLSLQEAENYPSQSLLEAMASGCAVIATDVGETRRLLDDSCSILIDSRPECLAKAVESLMNDPVRCRSLGLAARKRVLENHTLERFAEYFRADILGLHHGSSD